MEYRTDINGIRAWAILLVLLFHFKVPGLTGGFVGVDLFFVISGYLMTAILNTRNYTIYTITRFYLNRIKRVYPALLTMVSVICLIGWFTLPNVYLNNLIDEILAALKFTSNFKYWQESGYFSDSSEEKWLLHSWTLSLEAQFYLLYPLFFLLTHKYKEKSKATLLVLIALFSFALAIYLSINKPTTSFFLLPSRTWEFLMGGIAYYLRKKVELNNSLISRLCILTIVIFSIFIDTETLWPGYLTLGLLLPLLLILVQKENTSVLLQTFFIQWTGTRSYSIYLWHWPIIVYMNTIGISQSFLSILLGISFSILLGHISYELVENKLTKFISKNKKRLISSLVIVFISLVITLNMIKKNELNNDRVRYELNLAANEKNNYNETRFTCLKKNASSNRPKLCLDKTDINNLDFLLIGDSHADAIFSAFTQAANENHLKVDMIARSSCPTVPNFVTTEYEATRGCEKYNDRLFNLLKSLPPSVNLIFVNRINRALYNENEGPLEYVGKPRIRFLRYNEESIVNAYEANTKELLCDVLGDKHITLFQPIPEMGVSVPKEMVKRFMTEDTVSEFSITLDDYYQRSVEVRRANTKIANSCGITIADPITSFCDEKNCYGTDNLRPLYFDDDHLSEFGNKKLKPLFINIFNSKVDH